mmetsp:Transcript_12874/g.20237  ORF Transcript_12874/g.20237 Transcript_12874/m.20237 type:complete len:80 (-) Transcript_12874:105-344(-)
MAPASLLKRKHVQTTTAAQAAAKRRVTGSTVAVQPTLTNTKVVLPPAPSTGNTVVPEAEDALDDFLGEMEELGAFDGAE